MGDPPSCVAGESQNGGKKALSMLPPAPRPAAAPVKQQQTDNEGGIGGSVTIEAAGINPSQQGQS